MHIPVRMGLLGDAGDLRLQLEGVADNADSEDNTEMVLEVTEPSQRFTFTGLPERPVPSLLRGFSAPVKLRYRYSREQLAFIMGRDSDGFSRWDAAQQLAIAVIQEAQDPDAAVDTVFLDAVGVLLGDDSLDPAMVAETLRMPGENYLADIAAEVDVDAIHRGRQRVRRSIGEVHAQRLIERYHQLQLAQPYAPDAAQIAARSLRNTCLAYLSLASQEGLELAQQQYAEASNMTDRLAALTSLVHNAGAEASAPQLEDFYARWRDEPLVVNQWFQVQALNPQPGNLERVRALMEHADFDIRNPNKVRSLIGAFCSANPVNFHRADGAGYALLVEMIGKLDPLNPQIASRLMTPLTRWRRYGNRSDQMRAALEDISRLPGLSRDVYEVVNKSLAN